MFHPQIIHRLTVDSPENLEQNRLDYYLNRPTNTIYNNMTQDRFVIIENLILIQNQLMLKIMPQLKRKYQNTVIKKSKKFKNIKDSKMAKYYSLLLNIVDYINYLFQEKDLFRLDNIFEINLTDENTYLIKFDILAYLRDVTETVKPILYRYQLFIRLKEDEIILLDWIKKPKIKYDDNYQNHYVNPIIDQIDQLNKLNNCKKDEDCPYFRANRNYPNKFGYCQKNGTCQMPLGFEINKIACTNCKFGDEADCCKRQIVKSVYPKLASPDYRFIDDIDKRKGFESILHSRGLSI